MELLEPRLMDLNDEGAVLPLLLRVPVDVAQYTVLVPALWNADVQDWELRCMNSLVLDESHHAAKTEPCETPKETESGSGNEKENESAPPEAEKTSVKDPVPGPVSVLTRVMRLAQRYLLDPMSRQKSSQTPARTRHQSPAGGRASRSRTSASLPKTQVRSRRRSQQRGGALQPMGQQAGGDVTARDAAGCGKTERSEQTLQRSGTGPAHRRSNHSIVQHVRAKSLRLLRNHKNPPSQTPPSSSVLPPSLRASTLNPPGPEQQASPRMALIRELSSRHQTSVLFRNTRESKLI
ncbi:serine/arginine repetitive matrix protein 2-like [Stegastes partitus]|uniref:Serine/arginine repetitive matrix protein 2-like n=1 Tax=Stegastes partitus TaxID=144197 RepID=A0A9Y4KD01_9TELE|nr:PREDICTED: serine/arginine repetitive matrix protein 2-like [Stegastes partitus]